MKLTYLLAGITVLIFLAMFFFSKRKRRFYLLFIIYFLPFIDLTITPPEWGSLTVFDGISYISFFVLIKDFINDSRQSKFYLSLFVLLTMTLVLGSLNSANAKPSMINILSIFPVFIYAKLLLRECFIDKTFQTKLLQCIKVTAIFSVLFIVAQLIIGLKFNFYTELNQNTREEYGIRYPGFFHDPQKFGQYLSMLSFIFLINLAQVKKPKFINYLFFGTIILCVVLTGSRSAFLGLATGMLLLFFFLGFEYKIFFASLLFIGFIVTVSSPASFVLVNRTKNFDQDLSYRNTLWKESSAILKENPLLGIGLGNFKNYEIKHSDNYYITPDNDVIFFDQPESGYWKILTETGIFGFGIIVLLILTPVVNQFRDYIKGKQNYINIFFIAGLIGWMVSFTSLYSISDKRILVFIVTLVCFLISSQTVRRKKVVLKRISVPDMRKTSNDYSTL